MKNPRNTVSRDGSRFITIAIGAMTGLLVAFSSINATAMDLVREGRAVAVIVIPINALSVVQYAAQELCWHVEKASGARLTIVAEDRVKSSQTQRIYLGECSETRKVGVDPSKLPVNASIIRVIGDSMFLAGRDGKGAPPLNDVEPMGTLFAVYEWLDTQMAVRWLWPGELGTHVPARKTITSGPEGEKVRNPPFIHTKLRIGGNDQCIREMSVWLRRHRFARPVSFEYGHAFTKYWERFGKTHPEYFALRQDGKREPLDQRHNLVQMCVSNSDLHKQIIADWLEQRKRKPSLPWINGVENDKRGIDPSCTCEMCTSWDPKAKIEAAPISLSDRYAKFWLALQKEGRKYDPEATVAGYAYAGYSVPPVKTKLNDHIIIWIVPPYYFPLSGNDMSDFRKLWDGWAKTGARLVLRPNYFLEGYCMPYVFSKQFGEEFKYAHEHGLIGTDFSSLTGMWGVQGPNLYMLGRLHAQPDMKVSAVLKEYYAGFGPAAKQISAYFDYWERVTQNKNKAWDKNNGGGWSKMSYAGDSIYTPKTFQGGYKLLADARLVAANTPVALQRVEFLAQWLKHAELAMEVLATYHASKRQPKNKALKIALVEAQANLDEYRKQIENEMVATNLSLLNKVEIWSGWRHAPLKTLKKTVD